MRKNSYKAVVVITESKIGKLINEAAGRLCRELRRTAEYSALGMRFRQWLAMWLICLLLLPLLIAPAGGAPVLAAANFVEAAEEFEPVNPPLSVWQSARSAIGSRLDSFAAAFSRPVFYDEKGAEVAFAENKETGGPAREKTPSAENRPAVAENGIEKKAAAKKPGDDLSEGVKKFPAGLNKKTAAADPESPAVVEPAAAAPSPTPPAAENLMPGRFTSGTGSLQPELPEPTPNPNPGPTPPPIWTESQWRSQFTADNNLGNPTGQAAVGNVSPGVAGATRDRTKTSNFSFNLPIAALPGRGPDASVSATYNSQVWTKLGSIYTYNIDRNWLSPGFNLSFGYLDYADLGTRGVYDVISPDGTRHFLFYKETTPNGWWSLYESADGEFVQTYRPNGPILGGESNIWVRFADGTNVGYGGTDNYGRRYATYIVDRNGNYLTISYLSDGAGSPGSHGGRIDKIVDTLGREIVFHYDNNTNVSQKKLLSVSTPGMDGGPRIEVVRFIYENVAFQPQGRFDGSVGTGIFNTSTIPNTQSVLRYVYYPGTKTGYKYDYSTHFGMIYQITQLAGMNVTENGVTGEWVNWTKYNYPGTNGLPPGPSLTDLPKFNQRTDEWRGRDQSVPYVHTYQVADDGVNHLRTTRVILPDGNISETKTIWKPAEEVNGVWTDYWDDGLTKESSLLAGNGNVLNKQIYEWQEGSQLNGRKNPRLSSTVSVNETGQSTKTVFSQYDDYNNPREIIEYGFPEAGGGRQELKKTVISYVAEAIYKEVNLIHLPKKIEIFANGGSIPVSKVTYEYDDYQNMMAAYPAPPPNITNRADAVQFRWESNPFVDHNIVVCGPLGCVIVPVDYPQARIKGNLTKVTAFSDAALASDANAAVTTTKYDMLGNAVSAGLDCCQQKVWEYLKATEYAYPTKITKGSDANLVYKAEYDSGTGLVTKIYDQNNQPTAYEYEPDTLRQRKITYPNGGYTMLEYSDKLIADPAQLATGFVRTSSKLDESAIVQSYTYFNGRGTAVRNAGEASGNWLISAFEFDSFGRVSKKFNSFYAAAPTDPAPVSVKFTKVVNFDGLGRPTKVQLQDGNLVDNFYNEETVTYTDDFGQTRIGIASRFKDQADKERRQIVDVLGRIIRIDEATALGLGNAAAPNQATHYYYDGNDNLARIVQKDPGGVIQERKFKHDSLSRLTHEKQVEATPTLNDNGDYGTPAADKWTKVTKFDAIGRVSQVTDARGVKTNFVQYDGLNRARNVTFSDGTPEIKYYYDQARPGFFNQGALTRIETVRAANPRPDTPDTAVEFDYDLMQQVKRHRQTIAGQTYNLEYNYNLAGQLTGETYPSGKTVAVDYDNNGRLSGISDQSRTYLADVRYQSNYGEVSAMTLGNGIRQSFDYNDRLQLKQIAWAKDDNIVQRYDYTFGEINSRNVLKNNGKLAQIDSYIGGSVANPTKQFTQKFVYDSVGRLKKETEARADNNQQSYQQIFDYDRFGNRYLKAADNPASQNPLFPSPIETNDIDRSTNRFTSNTGTVYDDAGNVAIDGKFRNLKYSYDAAGRMFKAASLDNVNQANSTYDGLGQRSATQINGVWSFFIYDAFGKMIAEYGGRPPTDEGGVKYVLQDIQGSARAVTSINGTVKARMDYQAFGEEISSSVGQRTSKGYAASDSLRQKYALTERDEATGLDHVLYRKYENKAGRWTSPDPYNGSMSIANPQTLNRYSYVLNQPTNFVDPNGLSASPNWLHAAWVLWSAGCSSLGSEGRIIIVCNQSSTWNAPDSGASEGDSVNGGTTNDKELDECVRGVNKHFQKIKPSVPTDAEMRTYLNALGDAARAFNKAVERRKADFNMAARNTIISSAVLAGLGAWAGFKTGGAIGAIGGPKGAILGAIAGALIGAVWTIATEEESASINLAREKEDFAEKVFIANRDNPAAARFSNWAESYRSAYLQCVADFVVRNRTRLRF